MYIMQASLSYSGYKREILIDLVKAKSRRLIGLSNHAESLDLLDEIGAILERLDPAASTILQAIDAKGQDFGTYFVATYSETKDLEQSLRVYRAVKDLVRYVLLMDRYYEVGNLRFRRIAKSLLANFRKKNDLCPRYLLNGSLEQFWPFWQFEQKIKRLMLKGYNFSTTEIRHFNLFKASDAPLIYCSILESILPNFNPNVALTIHYNQALQDIDDDFDDIAEDMHDQMPNIFLLSALSFHEPSLGHHVTSSKRNLSMIGRDEFTVKSITELIDQYSENVEKIEIPSQFQFLKLLSRAYAARMRKKLGVQSSKSRINSALHS